MVSVIAATAATGLVLLAVALAISYGIDWRSHDIIPRWRADSDHESLLAEFLHHPAVWTIAFVGVTLGVTALTLAAVGAFGLSLPIGLAIAAAPFGVLLFAFLVAGTYAAARGRRLSPAGATLVSALVLGTVLLIAVAGNLLMGS